MPVRSKRLTRGNVGAANTNHLVYSVAADETVILKDLRLWVFGAAVTRAQVWVDSGPVEVRLVDQALASNQALGLMPWVVMMPGDELWVRSTQPDTLTYWVSGAELEGQAD